MVASAAARERVHTLRLPRSVASLGPIILVAFTWMMLVVAAWLCIRHLAGKLQQPLSFTPLLAVGLISAAAVSALRCGWWRAGRWPTRRWSLATLLWLLPTLAALLLAVALSIRGTSTAALCALWGTLLLNELLWGRYVWQARRGDSAGPPSDAPLSTAALSTTGSLPVVHLDRLADGSEDGDMSLPGDVSQQMTRTQSAQDGDTMAGVLRAMFQPGERSRNLHVAFCPPMPSRPTVEVIQLSGPRTRVKAADVQPFGVRFDLRLVTASQQEENVLIHFEARCSV